MMTIRQGPPEEGAVFDVCVIGSGPAGLATALSCSRQGLNVVILEGGTETSSRTSGWPVRILDERIHVSLDTATRERLGGTSSAWGGTCVPFDSIDLEARHWVPESGWPVDHDDLNRWTQEAAGFLDCGTVFEDASGPPPLGSFNNADLGRLTRRATMDVVYRDELVSAKTVTACLGCPVEKLCCDASGERVEAVEVRHGGTTTKVRASNFVVAGGGLRSTYLLLLLAREWPRHFAGGRAPLGRYYMGHVTGETAIIVFSNPLDAAFYLYAEDGEHRWLQRRIKPTAAQQEAHRLLATAFVLRAPWPADPRHGDGSLSLLALGGAFPPVARKLNSKRLNGAVAALQFNGGRHHHLRNILASPVLTAQNFSAMLKRRRVENLPMMVLNRSGRYALRYHTEQVPRRESRLYLDPADPSCLVVDFRYHEIDFVSVLRSHELLDEDLRRSGIGRLEYKVEPSRRLDDIETQAVDGYHQIGTTRMSLDPGEGVVDADCRVHGIDNLFVASASTFPTSGSANPTLAVVALALRLADHLAKVDRRIVPSVNTVVRQEAAQLGF